MGVLHPLVPCLPLQYFVVICGKYDLLSITFSLRPDEAMLGLAWQKLVCANKINFVTAIQGT